MLLEPWTITLPMASWERSNTRSLAREKTTDKEKENDTGHRGQLLPDIFSKPEWCNTQLKKAISASKSTDTLSLHTSQGSDQPTAPGLQVSSCSKARLAQHAFPSLVFLHCQVYITVFSPVTSYRAGGLHMLCMCMGWQQRKLLNKRKRLNSRETATFLSKRTGGQKVDEP